MNIFWEKCKKIFRNAPKKSLKNFWKNLSPRLWSSGSASDQEQEHSLISINNCMGPLTYFLVIRPLILTAYVFFTCASMTTFVMIIDQLLIIVCHRIQKGFDHIFQFHYVSLLPSPNSQQQVMVFVAWCGLCLPSCLHLQLVCSALELSGKIFHKQCHSLFFQQASYDFHGSINVSRSMIYHNGAEWNLILIYCSVSIHKLLMYSSYNGLSSAR